MTEFRKSQQAQSCSLSANTEIALRNFAWAAKPSDRKKIEGLCIF
jgi:hypothetical protein